MKVSPNISTYALMGLEVQKRIRWEKKKYIIRQGVG